MSFPRIVAVLLSVAALGCNGAETVDPILTGTGVTGTETGVDGGDNHAPEMHKIGDKLIGIGQTLVIEPKATDLDGDTLTWSVFGAPESATWQPAPPRFTWTPETFVKPTSVTFRVFDGEDADLEKILITVSDAVTNQAPVFYPVPDQFAEVGVPYFLQLQATDQDGDTLTFGVEGPVPQDAALSASEGTFGWTPPPGAEGKEFELRFSVSDGQLSAELPVRFFVLGAGQNKPPSFAPIPPQVAPVGQQWTLILSATDPENDPLTFGVVGQKPEGFSFDPTTQRATWTPLESHVGTHSVTFDVSDGQWTIKTSITLQVPESAPTKCGDDVNEPNNTPESATEVTTGQYEKLSICDTESNPVDSDWFEITLVQDQTLSVEVLFEQTNGDIDVSIYSPADTTKPVAVADSVTDNEALAYTVPASGPYLIKVFGTGTALFNAFYEMTISTAGLSCVEDDNEPNDNFQSATPLVPGDTVTGGQLCPNDPDIYTFEMPCGADLTATLTFDKSVGNLDMYLYRSSDTSSPAAEATGTSGNETLLFSDAPLNEPVYLLVTGEPPESTTNTYSLQTSVSGEAGCSDDAFEPNDTKNQATLLETPSSELEGLKTCCGPDWFFLPLQQGDGFLAVVKSGKNNGFSAKVLDFDGVTVLAEDEPDEEGLIIALESAAFSGNFYLVVEGPPGHVYGIDVEVITTSGCQSTKACPSGQICVLAAGACVNDTCQTDADCPAGQEMPCEDFHCLSGCTYDADCKLAQACKGFSFGQYCGDIGGKATGESCFESSACSGSDSCFFQELCGYCTNIGCQSNADCVQSDCVEWSSTTLCAAKCASNNDCRKDEGYSCQPKELVNGIPTNVCLPVP